MMVRSCTHLPLPFELRTHCFLSTTFTWSFAPLLCPLGQLFSLSPHTLHAQQRFTFVLWKHGMSSWKKLRCGIVHVGCAIATSIVFSFVLQPQSVAHLATACCTFALCCSADNPRLRTPTHSPLLFFSSAMRHHTDDRLNSDSSRIGPLCS